MENRIRMLREQRHMTQVRLSIELEVSQETVSGYESGKHYPSYSNLVRMSQLFGVGIDYLMGRSQENVPYPPAVSSEEQHILNLYRMLSTRQREKAEAYLQGLSDMS
ncbi:MAG: XRE family transcriptional regulator [Clostridia bacterium]|nr:XRE family transcriptional regulator [Clostridia bacterium]